MREILHGTSLSDAESLRIALEAEGIEALVRPHVAGMAGFIVSVADEDYERAVDVRRAFEREAGDRPTTVVPVRLLVVTLLLAAIALLALFITLLRHR